MNDNKHPFDEREWRLQERALREERLASADSGDAEVESYRRIMRALREPMHEALPSNFSVQVAARAAKMPMRSESRIEQWLVRFLSVAFAVSALYFIANDGGEWLRASLQLLPAADATALRGWGLALGACVAMTWAFGRLRIDNGGHALH